MATAFSQAALAEAKRAMDKAQTEFDKVQAATKAAQKKFDDLVKERNELSRLVAEAQNDAINTRVNESEPMVALFAAKADYDKMLALSKQQR